MVDTRTFDGMEAGLAFGDNLVRILLAGMLRDLDDSDVDDDEDYR